MLVVDVGEDLLLEDLGVHILLVIAGEHILELLNVRHHLRLCGGPIVDLFTTHRVALLVRLDAQHDAEGLNDALHAVWGVREGLELDQVVLIDAAHGGGRGVHRRHRDGEVRLALLLDRAGVAHNRVGLRLLNGHLLSLLVSLCGSTVNLGDDSLHLSGLGLEDGLVPLEGRLHLIHRHFRVVHDGQAALVAPTLADRLALDAARVVQRSLDKVQKDCRRDVHVDWLRAGGDAALCLTAGIFEHRNKDRSDRRHLRRLDERGERLLLAFLLFAAATFGRLAVRGGGGGERRINGGLARRHLREAVEANLVKVLFGPREDPVNRAAVRDGGEAAEAVAEGRPNGAEAERKVEVLPDAGDEHLHRGLKGEVNVHIAEDRAEVMGDGLEGIGGEEAGHLAGVQ